jgi:hypothetical protein
MDLRVEIHEDNRALCKFPRRLKRKIGAGGIYHLSVFAFKLSALLTRCLGTVLTFVIDIDTLGTHGGTNLISGQSSVQRSSGTNPRWQPIYVPYFTYSPGASQPGWYSALARG